MGWLSKIGNGFVSFLFLLFNVGLFLFAMDQDGVDNPLIAIALLSIVSFVATVIHELGHAWAADKMGARVETIAAIPFRYLVQSRRLTFERYWPSGDIGGYVLFSHDDEGGRYQPEPRKEIWIAAAGPLANLASAGAVLLLLAIVSSLGVDRNAGNAPTDIVVEAVEPSTDQGRTDNAPPPRATILPTDEELSAFLDEVREKEREEALNALLTAFAQLFIAVSIVLGLLNLIPYKNSDGANILMNWRRLKTLAAQR